MQWTIKHGDILDVPTDVLVCSANVYLNLSGGVGGTILLRYGDAMRRELHRMLVQERRQFVQQGEVIATPPCGTPYRAVFHAVAVDGFYQSSPEIIRTIVGRSFEMAAKIGAKRVALTALATGFGRLSIRQFAEGIFPLLNLHFPPLEAVIIGVRHETESCELHEALNFTTDYSD